MFILLIYCKYIFNWYFENVCLGYFGLCKFWDVLSCWLKMVVKINVVGLRKIIKFVISIDVMGNRNVEVCVVGVWV